MGSIQECALSFQALLNYEYHFIIGRKGQLKEFRLTFDKSDFHHLIGLSDNIPSFLFLGKRNDDENEQMCRTFFRVGEKDYTVGQSQYTLLKKSKINLITGEVIVQYDRLSPKEEK